MPSKTPGAVVEAVRADVDLRVGPVDELAVHPDLLGLAALQAPPFRVRRDVTRGPGQRPSVRARVRRTSSDGARPSHVRSGAGPDPDRRRGASSVRSMSTCGRPRERERRHAAGLEAGRELDLLGVRDLRLRRRRPPRRSSARRRGGRPGPARRTGGRRRRRRSDLTICASSQPTARRRPRAVGVPSRELLDRGLGPGFAQERGDALDGLGPRHAGGSRMR